MNTILRSSLGSLYVTLCIILNIGFISAQFMESKLVDYHYSIVNQIESSALDPATAAAAVDQAEDDGYTVIIYQDYYEDAEGYPVWKITTSRKIVIPIMNLSFDYTKESIVR